MNPTRAHLTLFTIVLLWGGSFAAIKHLLGEGLTGPDVAVARYLVAAPGFAVCLALAGGVRRYTRRDVVRLAAAGLMVVCLYHLALNVGERYTSSGTAAVIVGTAPGITLGLACLLRLERFSATRAAGLAIAFAGVVVVILLGSGQEISFENAKGPLIVLGAPLAFALFNVITKPLLARHSPLGVSAAASLIGTAALLPLTSRDVLSTAGTLDAWDWTLILYLGLICTLFAYVAWTAALGHLDASRAVAYIYLVPVFAVIVGAVTLGEEITAWLLLGGLLVIAGVALAQFGLRRSLPRAVPVRGR